MDFALPSTAEFGWTRNKMCMDARNWHGVDMRVRHNSWVPFVPRFQHKFKFVKIIRLFLCLPQEYGLNRELLRFMNIRITTDRFHECNHTTCTPAFRSSEYDSDTRINSEAAEQMNSVLRRIGKSTTYMSPKLFLKTLSFFVGYHNFKAKSKWNKYDENMCFFWADLMGLNYV